MFAILVNLPRSPNPAPLSWAMSFLDLTRAAKQFYPAIHLEIIFCYPMLADRHKKRIVINHTKGLDDKKHFPKDAASVRIVNVREFLEAIEKLRGS